MRIAILGALLVGVIEAEAVGDFRGVVELTSYGDTVQVYVNGNHIPVFKGGTSENVQFEIYDTMPATHTTQRVVRSPK